MNLNKWFVLAGIVFLTSGLWAQSPLPGSEETLTLYSPEFMAGGTNTASLTPVQGDILNPAASGGNQRTTFDLNTATLFGSGLEGFGLNAGVSYPTRYGVITGSVMGLFSNTKDFNAGSSGGLSLSFAKDVYRNLYLGVGMSTGLNAYQGSFLDWTMGLDLGMMHFLGDVGPLKDFRYGLALRDIGKTPETPADAQPLPSPFTLGASADFRLVKDENLNWGVHSDLSLPTFQNLRFTLGSDITLWKVFGINFGLQADARRILEGKGRSLIPSVGLTLKFVTDLGDKAELMGVDQKYSKNELLVSTSATMLADGLYAGGLGLHLPIGVVDRTAPKIVVDYPKTEYISPNNDGKKDSLILPIKISDERYIKSYVLEIRDDKDAIVRTIKNKDDRPENEGLANFMDKLFEVKSGIAIPETLRWDGNTDGGAIAADGKYTFVLKAVDDNLNEGQSAPQDIFVDNSTPIVVIDAIPAPDLIFSPDGDGNKDELTLTQSGSLEDKWEGAILNSFGETVRLFTQENTQPGKITWDGKDNLGQNVPDGVYSYRISTTDRADNTASVQMDNIIVNTQVTPVVITLNYRNFSPNGDGVQDTVVLIPSIPVKDGVGSWKLEILDSNGKAVKTTLDTSGKLPPTLLMWDGKIDSGTLAPEGSYTAKLSLVYVKGNKPVSISPEFILDITPPSATALVDGLPSFSPDGDNQRDQLPIVQDASKEDLWIGEILDAKNQVVKTWSWRGSPEKNIAWDGLNEAGLLQPSGDFTYSLKSTDQAGNSFKTATRPFKLDTLAREALISAEGVAFSPNGDNKKDQIGLFLTTNEPQGLLNYTVTILDKDGKSVRKFQGGNTLQKKVLWDGMNDQGTRVPEGVYKAKLDLAYANGNTPSAQSAFFTLDVTFPVIEVASEYGIFSPNEDGKKDKLIFKQKSSVEESWIGKITDSKNNVIKTFNWKGSAGEAIWNGKDEAGNLMADGAYKYEVSCEDAAGNITLVSLPGIQLDNRQTNLFLTLDKNAFSPALNGDKGLIKFNIVPTLKEGIESWSLKMVNKTKGVVKEFTGVATPPAQILWDGKDDKSVVEGSYQAELVVKYLKGDEPKVQSTAFLVDASAPVVSVDLSPDLFSPDNDGFADELTIAIKVTDLVGIDTWNFKINEPEGSFFTEFAGKETPAQTLLWDGRSKSGELVQAGVDYPYILSVTDKLGQTTTIKGLIPIDILVIKDGDRYKIAVPSITFEPNRGPLLNDNSDASRKNQSILTRVATILNRFSTYRVEVEGHANATQYQSAESLQKENKDILVPLSLERAKAVKAQLVKNGVANDRLSVQGMGGSVPVVKFDDKANVWKNRRVEFILLR